MAAYRTETRRRTVAHYAAGLPANGQQSVFSAYASAHAWEDFAENWSDYLHIVDTLERTFAFRLSVDPIAGQDPSLSTPIDFGPYREANFDRLNQSMGQPKLYPFLLAAMVIDKRKFIHGLIRSAM